MEAVLYELGANARGDPKGTWGKKYHVHLHFSLQTAQHMLLLHTPQPNSTSRQHESSGPLTTNTTRHRQTMPMSTAMLCQTPPPTSTITTAQQWWVGRQEVYERGLSQAGGLGDDEHWEDFTLSHRFHVDSMWTFDLFFIGVSPANSLSRIHLESTWSPPGVHLSIWTPPWNTGKYEFSKPDSTWINYILLYYIIIKKMHEQELNTQPSEWWLI